MQSVVCHLSSVHVRADVRVFYKECHALANAGYKVHLVVADGQGNDQVQGVCIHDVGKARNRLLRMLSSPLKVMLKALSLRAQVYHFHDPELLPIGLLLKLFTRSAVIYDAHECYPDDIRHKDYLHPFLRVVLSKSIDLLECFIARHLSAVVTITEHHAQRFLLQNPMTRVVCNYPILDEWTHPPYKSNKLDNPSLCYVGNITQKRGLSQLLMAMETLDITLHLAGAYEPAQFRDELQSMPAWNKVVEYGFVNRERAAGIISSAAIGVMLFLPEPNHINSLSTKVFEYMAAGICVLVSDFPVYRTLIQDQGCGLCVDPQDIRAISQAISKLIQDPDKLARMGAKGREIAFSTYSWKSQEQKLLHLYQEVISNLNKRNRT